MPRQRFQDPKVQTRTDVSRPFYFIRPFVPVVTAQGMVRRQKSIPLGFCDELSKRQAQARKQEVMATVNQGRFIVECQIPFKELAQKYLDARVPKLGAATQAKYRTHIENHLVPAFGELRLCDIDQPTIEAWLSEKEHPRDAETKGLGWWTLQDLKNILSAIFSAASEWKLWHGGNPCGRVKIGPKREVREKRIPGAKDLLRFMEAIRETAVCSAQAARLMVETAVTAGLRVSEVLGLQPRDVDGERRTLRVERRWHRGIVAEPKSRASRRERQIGDLTVKLLEFAKGKGSDQFIFGRAEHAGLPPDDRDIQQHVFRPAAEAVGIYFPGFGMHTFRRLNISWRQEVGAHPFEAMKAAGHAKPSTTWDYTVIDPQREREQVEKMLGRLTPTSVN